MPVSELALGSMLFGAIGNTDHDESVRMIHTALGAGINFVDTADVYSRGSRRRLPARPSRVAAMTCAGHEVRHAHGADDNQPGGTLAPQAFDLAVPPNQVRQEAVRDLTRLAAEAGLPLTHLATAFVRSYPAVTSVLIGPRRPEQLDDLLAGTDVELSENLLNCIDEIVPPGTEINPADNYLAAHPALGDKRLRRR